MATSKKWELARYFIDAKKCVDSILYLAENAEKVSMIDIREKVSETRRKFYINCCVVLDKSFKNRKKEICEDEIISRIYYERDKNSAHKDDKYMAKQYTSLIDIAKDMKVQLYAVKNICVDFLPQNITVDYVPFDSNLFRLANGITKEKEEKILSLKYPLKDVLDKCEQEESIVKKVFYDTEDIRYISEKERVNYATIIRMGICMEESIQRLQDDCIKTNVLTGNTDVWVSLNLQDWKKLRKYGLVDKYDIPVIPKNNKEQEHFIEILNEIFPEI